MKERSNAIADRLLKQPKTNKIILEMVNLPKTEGKKVEGALSVCGECGSEQQAGGVSCGDG